jgi:hypothetical protein
LAKKVPPKLQFFAAMLHNQRDSVRPQRMLHMPVLGSTQGVVVLFAHHFTSGGSGSGIQ